MLYSNTIIVNVPKIFPKFLIKTPNGKPDIEIEKRKFAHISFNSNAKELMTAKTDIVKRPHFPTIIISIISAEPIPTAIIVGTLTLL